MKQYGVFMVSLMAMAVSAGLWAADLEREKRMANQIVDAILDGDPVYLDAGNDHEFLGIYTEADEPKGAVIVMHGRGFHPDWSDTTNPLRVGLIERGWTTLSIQMPVLEKEAKYNDYVPIFHEAYPRIEAAVRHLEQEGFERIVIAAHSCSVHMVNAWIKEGRFKGVDAFIGIGMGATDYKQPMVHAWQFEKLTVPVLDIYGSDDYPAVQRMADDRLQGIKLIGGGKSSQVVVQGANHYFLDKGDELVDEVGDWLDSL